VLAVEQDEASRSGPGGSLAELSHDGMLSARDSDRRAHPTVILTRGVFVLASTSIMKARLIKRFEVEIVQLERELTKELPKEIQRARELGDLRENAEYQAAKERQRFVQARVAMLRKRVSEIQLMNLERIPADRAGFGSKLTLIENEREVAFELVMPEDADPDRGLISVASPIGRALVGKEEGDEVSVPTPAGIRVFQITGLVTIHDEE